LNFCWPDPSLVPHWRRMLAGFGNFRRTLLPCRNDYPATFREEPEMPETTEKSEICLIENNLCFSWTFYGVEMHLLFYDNVYSSSSVGSEFLSFSFRFSNNQWRRCTITAKSLYSMLLQNLIVFKVSLFLFYSVTCIFATLFKLIILWMESDRQITLNLNWLKL
jgi:hypothetical protein